MKRYFIIAVLAIVTCATSCVHKDLCEDHREHAHRYHINIIADYRYDWEEHIFEEATDWEYRWPDNFSLAYDDLRPGKPDGLRVVNENEKGNKNTHNIGPDGGVVVLYEGLNNILLYNNDTEYILFSRSGEATTRATTRTRTRAEFKPSTYAHEGENTLSPPDMLYANYIEAYLPEKVIEPTTFEVTLQPLVYTYKIRFEFKDGIEFVSRAEGALSGMAASVTLETGETSEESATILFDKGDIIYTNDDKTEGYIRALVMSWGTPGFPHPNYPTRTDAKHALTLDVRQRNNKVKTFEFDVTDQLLLQPHGGVIIVSDLEITKEEGQEGSGGFVPEVDEWGPTEDIELPL
jgi:hypothetical protein